MDIDSLVRAENPELSLSASFYCSPDVFDIDMERVVAPQWLFVGHISMLPQPGSYFLVDVGAESIIVVRQPDDTVAAFYNVCRHRGSRICEERSGATSAFVCPYHAWTYAIDGSLRRPPYMPDDFDHRGERLASVAVEMLEGLVFIATGDDPLPFDGLRRVMEPYLSLNGAASAKLALRRSYPTEANWKLVVENFQECYHCVPSHKLYCSIHSKAKLIAFGAGPGSGPPAAALDFEREMTDFQSKAEALGTWLPTFEEAEPQDMLWVAGRFPIGRGAQSETADGTAVSRLMGNFTEFDGGQSTLAFNPFGYVMGNNDHFVLVRFTPRAAMQTDVEFYWFVHGDAEPGADYALERLIEVWDVTTLEDKTISEANQAGIGSKHYRPGRYSQLETRLITLKQWYLRLLTKSRAVPSPGRELEAAAGG